MAIKKVRLEHTDAPTYGRQLLASTITAHAFYASATSYWIPVEDKQLATKYYVDLSTTGTSFWDVDSISADFIYPTPYPPKILLDEGYLLYRSFGSDVYIFDSNLNEHNFISVASASSHVKIQPDNLSGIYFTASGISQFNNVNVLGTLTARRLYFESTTAVEIVVTGSHVEINGSLSITGNGLSGYRKNDFEIFSSLGAPTFISTSGGRLGLGSGIGSTEPIEDFHFSGSGVFFDCNRVYFRSLLTDVVDFDCANGLIKFTQLSATAPKVIFDINGENTLSITGTSNLSGTSNINGYQSVTGDIDIIGDINVNGLKNFKLDHPDPEKYNKYYLVHSALEGPYPSVYINGKIVKDKFTKNIYIKLPSYFKYLVDKDSIKVFIESIGYKKHEYVKNINENEIHIRKNFFKNSSLDYMIIADRKLKEKFEVEIKK